ncbi:MAG: hypothetical protein J5770_07200 [Bacteroidaceae bacterium]|nr:hypothetical protein [Bacteroidaceae bacterium]
MKKVFFSFAVVAMATMMVSCGGNTSTDTNTDSVAVETEMEAEEVEAEEPEATAIAEDRGWYTVEIPEGFEAKQYVSEMIVSGPVELNFKEQADADVANWAKVMDAEADEQLDEISAADVTWQVYKNAEGYPIVYLAQMGNGVIRVGSSSDNPNDAAVLAMLNSIKLK